MLYVVQVRSERRVGARSRLKSLGSRPSSERSWKSPSGLRVIFWRGSSLISIARADDRNSGTGGDVRSARRAGEGGARFPRVGFYRLEPTRSWRGFHEIEVRCARAITVS